MYLFYPFSDWKIGFRIKEYPKNICDGLSQKIEVYLITEKPKARWYFIKFVFWTILGTKILILFRIFIEIFDQKFIKNKIKILAPVLFRPHFGVIAKYGQQWAKFSINPGFFLMVDQILPILAIFRNYAKM